MKKLVFILLSAVFIFSCGGDDAPAVADLTKYTCGTNAVTYDLSVKPILSKSCALAGCHDSKTASDGYDYSNYGQAKIHAAKPEFMGSLERLSGYSAMPKGGAKLSTAELTTLACWIKGGLKEK